MLSHYNKLFSSKSYINCWHIQSVTTETVKTVINDYWNSNMIIIDVSENSVSLQVSGVLFATFGLDNKFIVANIN